ncbi:MAG: DMT family transporter [Armatimonadetes bacterium]|nr:DMT family transporter [Armatimonadota bacterium]
MDSDARRTGWPLVSLAAMLWASDLVLRPKAQAAGISSIQIVLFEHLALAVIFIPFLALRRAEWTGLSFKNWLGILFIAVFGSALATIMLTEAYRLGSPLLTILLQKVQPVVAVALAGVALKEKRKPLFWPLFVLALVATYLLAFGFAGIESAFESPQLASILLALGAATIWGTCTVVGRAAIKDLSPPVMAGWRFIIALPFLVLANFGVPAPTGAHVSVDGLWPIALIVLLPDALGMTLYYLGLKRTPASLAALAELAFPVTALVLGLISSPSTLQIGQWVGLVLLLACLQAIQATKSVEQEPTLAPQAG